MLVYGFGSFFNLLPGGDVSSLLLIYGFVISLLGFALAYAQLKPVPCKTTQEAYDVRDAQATSIQKQVREDVTRYRYGDEQHLDEALDRIFRFGKGGSKNQAKGVARRFTPVLMGVREELQDGAYTLVLEFSKKEQMGFEEWTSREDKFQSFFGPGVTAKVLQTSQGVDVELKCDGSGQGRDSAAQKDLLPPLMPGLKGRQQQ